MFLQKGLNKIKLHFINPILAIKFDLRKVYFFYARFILKFFYKINIPIEKSYFNPDYCDLYHIFKIVLNFNPKKCIEIGSGYSTFVILKALEINFKRDGIVPKLISLEQDDNYLKIHKSFISKNFTFEIKSIVEFVKTDLKIESHKGEMVSICTIFPNEKFEFFYEDRTDDEKYKIAGDAIKMENNMPKNFIICIDGMIKTVDFYKKNLKRDYYYSGGFYFGSTFIPKITKKFVKRKE
jgi:hypothetical protein